MATESKISEVEKVAIEAKAASRLLAGMSTELKNKALNAMAEALIAQTPAILSANQIDMAKAKERGISESLLDRLMLDEDRIRGIAKAVEDIVALSDPVGEVVKGWKVPNGLLIEQVRMPLGVIGIIYEARPNVTVDAAALTLKTGNAVILRGGSMAEASNKALTRIISDAAVKAGIPPNSIQALPKTDRESAREMMKLDLHIDLLVPRGGVELIKTVVDNATIPVLWAGAGNCHVYVHRDADFVMAEAIVINAKVQRPSVCNAAETLLVHQDLEDSLLPKLVSSLQSHDVTVFGCEKTRKLPDVLAATEEDWYTEYLDLKIAIKVVDSLEEAITHINKYGTLHSEVIVASDYNAAKTFTEKVDSAAVYVNASSRFTDGGEFGMGAEIGISTQKLHARGPMGLRSLTSKKYVILGTGQIR